MFLKYNLHAVSLQKIIQSTRAQFKMEIKSYNVAMYRSQCSLARKKRRRKKSHTHTRVDSCTAVLFPQGGDSADKPFGALSVPWLSKVEKNGVQKTIHTGKWSGTLIDDRKEISGLAGHIRKRAHY